MATLSINKNDKQKQITGGQSQKEMLEKIRALTETAAHSYKEISPKEIVTASPFKELFPVKTDVLTAIESSMKSDGYDYSNPVIIWKEENVLIDGHCRLQATINTGLKIIPVFYQSFKNEDEAVSYAYGLQFSRRNMDEADRFEFTESYLNNVVQTGKNSSGWKKESLAALMKVSLGTAQKYISVSKQATEAQKQKIRNGLVTVNAVYNQLKKQDKKESLPKEKTEDVVIPEPIEEEQSNPPITISHDHILNVVKTWMISVEQTELSSDVFIYKLEGVLEIMPENHEISNLIKTFFKYNKKS